MFSVLFFVSFCFRVFSINIQKHYFSSLIFINRFPNSPIFYNRVLLASSGEFRFRLPVLGFRFRGFPSQGSAQRRGTRWKRRPWGRSSNGDPGWSGNQRGSSHKQVPAWRASNWGRGGRGVNWASLFPE